MRPPCDGTRPAELGAPVVCATDNATVSAICDTIRRDRISAGEVEPGGIFANGHTVGVGDEIVTLRNDRRLHTTTGCWVRNGDRWTITGRHPDGALAVSSLTGHGNVVLPADYVAEHLHLAYALTVHKAQGLTVDRSVLVVDETTTAETLYVGLTRGRYDNTALACTDAADIDHHASEPPPAGRDLLATALARTASEDAATVELRRALAASESLAVLAPRLANVDAQIQREMPPDPSIDLERLAAQRAHVVQYARPGLFTRGSRHDRRRLEDLDERRAELEERLERHRLWLDDNADLFAYRQNLSDQVDARKSVLGLAAAVDSPAHLIELLGELPEDAQARERWISHASRIEAYRTVDRGARRARTVADRPCPARRVARICSPSGDQLPLRHH